MPHPWKEPEAFRAWQAEETRRRMIQGCVPGLAAGGFESESERRLCAALVRRGLRIHPQQAVPNRYGRGFWYRADLAYYEPVVGFRLAIEVDGSFKDRDSDRQRRLGNRDSWFAARGWHVLRFHAADCWRWPDACALHVEAYVRTELEAHRQVLAERGIGVAPTERSWAAEVRPGVLPNNVASFVRERAWAGPSVAREVIGSVAVGRVARWAALGTVALVGVLLLGAFLTPIAGSAAGPLALLLVLGVVLKEEPKRRRRRSRR